MVTLAEKVVGIGTLAVIDLAVFVFGGAVFLFLAVVATAPFAVALLHR